MKRLVWLGILVGLCSAAPAFAGQDSDDDGAICTQIFGAPKGVRGDSGNTLPPRTRGVFDVCYDGDQWRVQPPPNSRLTNRDAVWVRVRHFNFLRYKLNFEVTEERAESYNYLHSLWSTALGLSLSDIAGALDGGRDQDRDEAFVTATREVYRAGQAVQKAVDAALAPHKDAGLTRREVEQLRTATSDVQMALTALRVKHDLLQAMVEQDNTAFRAAFAGRVAPLYTLATNVFREASQKADAFLVLAQRSLGDEIKKIGTKDAGTRVTVVMTATDPNGARSEMETVHYFVQSNMPLVAHGGVSLSGLKDISFATVKRAAQYSEEDYFQQQSDAEQLLGYSTFLAWQLFAPKSSLDTETKQQKISLLVSMGTDLNAPGKRVYVGPSAMIMGRLVITGGAVIGSQASGADPIEPNVFRLVRHVRTTTWFTSVGVRVY